jgi:hypothetical protein
MRKCGSNGLPSHQFRPRTTKERKKKAKYMKNSAREIVEHIE